MKTRNVQKKHGDTKKVFWNCGTCSHTFFFLLNREFGHPKETEEAASDLLAGGLMNRGYQCGMLWGATLAAGAESYRRYHDTSQAISIAITAAQRLMESFQQTCSTTQCREITKCNLTHPLGLMKLMFKTILGGFINSQCFNMAQIWAPKAIEAATQGLSTLPSDASQPAVSCASEVAKKMGATNEESLMVAGFAGGIGLSGNGCGALAAAMWMKSLAWCKKHPGKSPPFFSNPEIKNTIQSFLETTDQQMCCQNICGKKFTTIEEHTNFIKDGGCSTLIALLAR